MISEFKQWFLRREPKTVGDNKDQELSYPLTIHINGTPRYHRYKKGDIPSERTWTKLFHSILFKLNREDRAKDQDMPGYFNPSMDNPIQGGHVTLATDQQARGNQTPDASKYVKYEGENGDENLYSRVPRVSHLPTTDDVINTATDDFQIDSIDGTIPNTVIIDTDPEILTRNHFLVSINPLYRAFFVDTVNKIRTYINSYELRAELTYNAGTPAILVDRDPASNGRDHIDTIKINIEDITFTTGTVSGSLTIGASTVSLTGYTEVVEVVPDSREYRVNVTINTL